MIRCPAFLPALSLALWAALLLPRPAAAADGSKLLELLPPGVQGVVVIDMEQVRSSPLLGKLMPIVRRDPQLGALLEEMESTTGLEPTRDLSTVLVASLPGERHRLRGFVLLQGKLQQGRIEKKLSQDQRLKQRDHAGRKVWEKTRSGPVFSAIFLRPDLLGFIHPSLLDEVLARAASPARGKVPPGRSVDAAQWQALLGRPERKGGAWFAGRIPVELRGNPDLGPLAQAEGLFGSVRLRDDLALSITGIFTDEALAQQLAVALMLIRTRLAQRPQFREFGLTPVLERLTAMPAGREARIELRLTGAELEGITTKTASRLGQTTRQAQGHPAKPAPHPAAAAESSGARAAVEPGSTAPAASPGSAAPAASPGSAAPAAPPGSAASAAPAAPPGPAVSPEGR